MRQNKRTVFGEEVTRIHMLGVGGMGMAPLAVYLAQGGFHVSGEDVRIPFFAQRLFLENKIEVTSGNLPEGTDLVVRSSAISLQHPILLEAHRRGIPSCRRGEMLAEAVRDRKLIAVVGSHGKTTTCGMLITAMEKLGFNFGYVLGGVFQDESISPAAYSAESDWVLAEVDESDGTIDRFSPYITIAVNVDWDHCDRYSNEGVLTETFAALFSRTAAALFINDGCLRSNRIVQSVTHCSKYTFGENGDYGCRLEEDRSGMSILSLEGKWNKQEVRLRASGRFNCINAGGAMAVCHYLLSQRLPSTEQVSSLPEKLLAGFPGIRRRQSILFDSPTLTIVEDYAHHPAEISAFLECMGRRWPRRRLVVVFQPHRYSRTRQFKTEFATVLGKVDRLFLLDVYAAAEKPIEGGRGVDLFDEVKRCLPAGRATFLGHNNDAEVEIAASLEPGDLLLFVGAGDIEDVASRFVDHVKEANSKAVYREEVLSPGRFARGQPVGSLGPRGTPSRPFSGLSKAALMRENEPLAKKTTLQVGGRARFYAEPACDADLQVLLGEAKGRGLAVYLIGRGSNMIIPDDGVAGMVIRLQSPAWREIRRLEDGRLWAGGGLRLRALCGEACKEGWAGFEFLEGIPGTVGGALRMNAGAMGGCFFDVVEEIHLMGLDGEKRILPKDRLRYEYRKCPDLIDAVALGAVLSVPSFQVNGEIQRRMSGFQQKRTSGQPREASAGCTFKNPEGGFAGRIIDELGLKGKRCGKAEVSEVHGNFIINRGKATSGDVVNLIRFVRDEVIRQRGIALEPEILFLGKQWEDVL